MQESNEVSVPEIESHPYAERSTLANIIDRLLQKLDKDVVNQLKQATEESLIEMNAIACGIEARHDLLIGYSEIVIQETINIAQHLGIPEKEIHRWAAAQTRAKSTRAVHTGYNGATELYTPSPSESPGLRYV